MSSRVVSLRRCAALRAVRPAPRRLGLLTALVFLLAPGAGAEAEARTYRVSGFELSYDARPAAGLPDPEELEQLVVELAWNGRTYVAPRGGDTVSFRLDAPPSDRPRVFEVSALRSVNEQILAELERRGFAGIRVAHDPRDIHPETGSDRRAGRSSLRVVVSVATVEDVRARSTGNAHATDLERIRRRSPLQPDAALREDALQEYLSRLSRRPGRRVTARLRPTGERDRIRLEYEVAERKPWAAYLRVSNTGTESTSTLREHVGLRHEQLTGRDDVLRLDYVTGNFDEVHAAVGSYQTPLPGLDRVRTRIDASWSRFDASELGREDVFSGRQWELGGELRWNAFHREGWFVDWVAGFRHQEVEIDDDRFGTSGETGFLLPRVGVRAERRSDRVEARSSLTLERNLAELGGTDADEIQRLGRLDVDRHFSILRWNGSLSLHPLAWAPGAAPDGGWRAHEGAVSLQGQHAFGDRLVPYHQQSVGGLYTVRGYPQSSAAGDDAVMGGVEYRFHATRLWAPGRVLGRPWDLSLRAFLDGARVTSSDASAVEEDETLWGAGLGLSLEVSRARVRFDWGRALRSIEGVSAGSNEYHVVGAIVF